MLFAINGKFLSEKRTGIHRYTEELVRSLDKISADLNLVLVKPKKTEISLDLKNIRVVEYGNGSGILWEQICFAFYCLLYKAVPINLCNIIPLLKPNGISCIHDVSYKANPEFFSNWYGFLSRTWHKINYWFICKFSKKIITISEFSKNEIIKFYKVKPEKISVISDSWQHISQKFSKSLNSENRSSGNYFFAMSSIAKNKNFKWVLELAKRNPEQKFKIAGSFNPTRFGENMDFNELENVEFLGYVSDEEAKTLMQNCRAFLFPSLYEGFGLPPMEALAVGAQIVVSNIPVLREIYGNSAHYVEPNNYDIDLEGVLAEEVEPAEKVLGNCSWEKSAEKLKMVLEVA